MQKKIAQKRASLLALEEELQSLNTRLLLAKQQRDQTRAQAEQIEPESNKEDHGQRIKNSMENSVEQQEEEGLSVVAAHRESVATENAPIVQSSHPAHVSEPIHSNPQTHSSTKDKPIPDARVMPPSSVSKDELSRVFHLPIPSIITKMACPLLAQAADKLVAGRSILPEKSYFQVLEHLHSSQGPDPVVIRSLATISRKNRHKQESGDQVLPLANVMRARLKQAIAKGNRKSNTQNMVDWILPVARITTAQSTANTDLHAAIESKEQNIVDLPLASVVRVSLNQHLETTLKTQTDATQNTQSSSPSSPSTHQKQPAASPKAPQDPVVPLRVSVVRRTRPASSLARVHVPLELLGHAIITRRNAYARP